MASQLGRSSRALLLLIVTGAGTPGAQADPAKCVGPKSSRRASAAILSAAPVCSDLGTILDSTCYFTCVQAGGHCVYGSCVGGTCTNVPFPPTSVCCAGVSSCSATVVSGTGDLAQVIHDCAYVGLMIDELVVGTCGGDGHCVPGG